MLWGKMQPNPNRECKKGYIAVGKRTGESDIQNQDQAWIICIEDVVTWDMDDPKYKKP